MNNLDHILRRLMLNGTASTTLTTGTAEDLYPLSNLYNARPGVPFRTTSLPFTIDIDLGSSINIADVNLLATNLSNLGGTGIELRAGNVFPPVAITSFGSNFENPDYQSSDYYGFVSLFPYRWVINASYRYWRFVISASLNLPFFQIGEIYFNPVGNYSWWDEPAKLRTGYSWPLRGDPVLQHERESETRMMRLGVNTQFENATKAQLASELEAKYRTQELAKLFPFSENQIRRVGPPEDLMDPPWYFGQSTALGYSQTFTDKWDGRDSGDSILQTFDGDGRI